jgi:hypothetical protein
MIKITAKKYINDQLVATFEYETENPAEISEKLNMLKSMGFQEISCN